MIARMNDLSNADAINQVRFNSWLGSITEAPLFLISDLAQLSDKFTNMSEDSIKSCIRNFLIVYPLTIKLGKFHIFKIAEDTFGGPVSDILIGKQSIISRKLECQECEIGLTLQYTPNMYSLQIDKSHTWRQLGIITETYVLNHLNID
jgi:hypothetical protein